MNANTSEHICWRGPPGSGKRYALHSALQKKATERGIPLKIQTKLWALEKQKESEADEEQETDSKDMIPFESSLIHFGFDVSRMSLQDRHILKPILERLGKGSHVLAGKEKAEARILVFYHIHLLSTESCLILQSLLEQEGNNISLWCTSEHPLPIRISHHFTEIGIGGKDKSLEKVQQRIQTAEGDIKTIYDPQTLFDKAVRRLCRPGPPSLEEVAGLRAFIYECLIRNVRWIECIHHLMVSILRLDIPKKNRLAALRVLAKQEGSASGQTIPSYRIPIAWESLFVQIREALSDSLPEEHVSSPAQPVTSNSKSNTKDTIAAVDKPSTKRGGSTVVKKRSTGAKPV